MTEMFQAVLFDNKGNEISRTPIDSSPLYALESTLGLAEVANWVNTSLEQAGCRDCVDTKSLRSMIENSGSDGDGVFTLALPNTFNFVMQ